MSAVVMVVEATAVTLQAMVGFRRTSAASTGVVVTAGSLGWSSGQSNWTDELGGSRLGLTPCKTETEVNDNSWNWMESTSEE